MRKPIPQYVDEMSDGAISRLKTLKATKEYDMHTFAFMTDTHNCSDYTERALYSLCQINEEVPVSFICLGGDYLCNNHTTPKQVAVEQLHELGDIIKEFPQKPPTFVVKGNHDENPFGKPENKVLNDEIYDILMFEHEKNFVLNANDPKSMYGYYDIPDAKIRAIFVDVMDKNVSEAGLADEQLSWIANTALKLPDNEWAVVLFSHYVPITSSLNQQTYQGGNALWEILRAFKNGGQYSVREQQNGKSLIDVSCDFTAQGACDVIGYICGHCHCDRVIKIDGISIATILSAASDNFGIEPDNKGFIQHKTRSSGEESAFSLFVVDKAEKRVQCIRCGAGDDFAFNY